jgi:hypothetical protein
MRLLLDPKRSNLDQEQHNLSYATSDLDAARQSYSLLLTGKLVTVPIVRFPPTADIGPLGVPLGGREFRGLLRR